MKVFIPAIGFRNDIKVFEIETKLSNNGNFEVVLTGNVADNIEKVVSNVFLLLKKYADYLEIKDDTLYQYNYQISFSEPDILKEGESSGIGIFLSVLSAIKGWNKEISCLATGEIDVNGNILPMYGVENKLQVKKELYTYIFVPLRGFDVKQNVISKNTKLIKTIFELVNYIKDRENEMVNV